MSRQEQLSLDLGLRGPGRWSRWRSDGLWRPLGRVLVSLVVAVACAGVGISLTTYRTTVAGIDINVTGSVTPSHRGLTIDSSVGSLQFRDVVDLPIGLHVTPRVDLDAVRTATDGGPLFGNEARADLREQAPALVLHFALAGVAGLAVGALVGGVLFDGLLLLLATEGTRRGGNRRRRLAEAGLRIAGVTVLVTAVAAATTAVTYRDEWYARYTVTGLLADVSATPARLAALDARDTGAADKLRAVLRLQDALTSPQRASTDADTAYRVLFISDVHRRNIYPYLQQYVDANDVALIVNTGDETLVGSTAELTPDYLASIAAITVRTPMVWVKGNHDSAGVAAAMDAVPGVTVLDGQVLSAYGLQLYGTADPRTYGASGAAGSDDPQTVTELETQAAATALDGLRRSTYLDLLLAHEPVEADVMTKALGASVRAQASGHVHRQNAESDLQTGGRPIRLVEGSTGLGGLLADAGDPMAFSILSVAPDCQFTRVVRYQLADPALPAETSAVSFGDNSSFVVHYFGEQPLAERRCSRRAGVGQPVDAAATSPYTVQQWRPDASVPASAPVETPSAVPSADEQGDSAVNATTPPPTTPVP